MAIFDEELDVYLIEEGDSLVADWVDITACDSGKDFDAESACYDAANIMYYDDEVEDYHEVHWLVGYEASSKGVTTKDERYGRMFFEK